MVGTTEVVATSRAASTTGTTSVAVAHVTVGACAQVGVEVVTTTPCRTVATVTVLVVTIVATDVFEVVGQGEQEVTVVSCITVVIPIGGRITTN